jgi:hypothetical protein
VTGRSIAVLVGEGEKHSIPADGAVLGGIALGAPGARNAEFPIGPCGAGTANARVVSNWNPATATAIETAAIAATAVFLDIGMSSFTSA